MQTSLRIVEILSGLWPTYFRVFSKLYRGCEASVEIMDRDVGDQPEAARRPLRGISYESKGSARGDILVEVGGSESPYIVHRIIRPRSVHVSDPQPGEEMDVQIEAEDGTVTLVRIRELRKLPKSPASGK